MTLSRISKRLAAYLAAPLIFFIGMAVMYMFYPPAFDDYALSDIIQLRHWGLPWPMDMGFVKHHYYLRWCSDNVRLGNLMVPFLMIPPKWLTGLIGAVFLGGFVLIMGKIYGFADNRSWKSMTLMCLVLTFIPDWRTFIPAIAYIYNYIPVVFFSSWALLLFLRQKDINPLLALGLGFVIGWWHEGVTAPLIAGMGLVWLMYRRYRSLGRTLFLVGLVLGLGILLYCPGSRVRIDTASKYTFCDMAIWEDCLMVVELLIFGVLSLLARRKKPGLLKSPLWIIIALGSAISVAIQMVTSFSRASVFAQMYCTTALAWLAVIIWQGRSRSLTFFGSIAALLLLGIHFVYTSVYTFHERRFINFVIDRERFAPGSVNYYDIIYPNTAPAFLMGKPFFNYLMWESHGKYYEISREQMLSAKFLPEQVRDFNPADGWRRTPQGAWERDGIFVRDYDGSPDDPRFLGGHNIYRSFITEYSLIDDVPFLGADGRSYVLVQPIDITTRAPKLEDVGPLLKVW